MRRILVLTSLLFLPFLNKAYHIDDTVFLRIARQIRQTPLSPYDFSYNWSLTPMPAWILNLNPPLNSYWLALIGFLAGENEIAAHAGFLIVTLACVALLLALARRFCRHPVLAAILTVVCPAFFVTATNVMADMPLLFFWLLAVWLVMRAAEERRDGLLWAAGAAISCAALTKYFGLALIPLLAAYWRIKSGRLSPHLAGFLLPLLAVALWGWYGVARCGFFHPLAAAGFGAGAERDIAGQIAVTASFLGGCLLWPVFALPLLWRLGARRLALAAAAMGLVLLTAPAAARWLWAVLALGGAAAAVFSAAGAAARRDKETPLLVLWLAGTVIFAAAFNWTVNARIFLPAVFPAAVLTLRWVESLDNPRPLLLGLACCAAASLLVSYKLALADQEIAQAGRAFSRRIRGDNARFIGHWGFQYYMEKEGARAFDYKSPKLNSGDKIFVSLNNSGTLPLPPSLRGAVRTEEEIAIPLKGWLTTVDVLGKTAGFYSSLFGPVPFSFGRGLAADNFLIQTYR